jgi:chromosome segregation ATPase
MSPRSAAIFRPKQPPRQLAPIDQEMMDSKLHELQPSWRLRVLLERLRLHLGVLLPVETRRAAQSGRRDSLKNSPRGDNPAANTLTTPRAKSTQFNLSTDSTVERVAAKLAALQDTQTPRSSTIKHFDDGTDDAELDAAFLDFDDTPEVDAFRAAGDELHISTPSALLAVMRETERLLTAHEHLENVSARAVSKANATQQRLASLESQRARLRLGTNFFLQYI